VYVWLADAYMPGNEACPKAEAAARAAIDRDPLVADAHAVLGYALSAYDWDREAGERELNRAIELDPNSANAHFFFGVYEGIIGRTDAGLKHMDRAIQIDPLSPLPYFGKEVCLYWGGRYKETIAAHRDTEEIAPGFFYVDSFEAASYRELGNFEESVRVYEKTQQSLGGQPLPGLAITYARMGRMQDARDTVRRVDAMARTSYVPLIWLAGAHDAVGDREGAIRLLEKSLAVREAFFITAKDLPELASLRNDPRAQKILEEAKPLKRTQAQRAPG
jgi:tetratricopeptide (TPR) repeat protein